MNNQTVSWAEVDEQGRIVLPPDVARQHGIRPGARLRIDSDLRNLRLHRSSTHLTKLYIEPTDICNLECRTCIRNSWDEPLGKMSDEVFEGILEGLKSLPALPSVFFGGLGEPLYHPRTIEMIEQIKALGARVELITNGTMLTEARIRQLIAAELDVLWVSIDGATPESYSDIRLGAQLPRVLKNLALFRRLRKQGHMATPEIGIAFVAMKRNIDDLPKVIKLGLKHGAVHFSISNVLPYTAELQEEILYRRTLSDITYLPSRWVPEINLPKMDINETTREAFIQALNCGCNVRFAGFNLGGSNDACPFVESGVMAVGWDGAVSPCLPLLHTHTSYLHKKPRINRRHVIGKVTEHSLEDLWNDAGYIAYRETVQGFGFAPCTFCGGCDLSEANEEDCVGNKFPACGGCLWAQGVIQCP